MKTDGPDQRATDRDPAPNEPGHAAPRRLPRWAKRILIVAAVLAALFVLRLVVGIGAAYAYYDSTPDFATFVAARATPRERVEAWLPAGKELARGAFSIGEAATGDDETRTLSVDVEIRHGEEPLLVTTVDLAAALDPETFARRGFAATTPSIQTRPGMHAIVQVSLLRVRETLGEVGEGRVLVDAVLAAGEGENVFRVVELEAPPPQFESSDPVPAALRLLFGLVHPLQDPPEEGILHQVRAGFSLSWRKLEGGSQGAGIDSTRMRTNGEAYSYATTVTARQRDGGGSSSTKDSWSQTYTWNERLW